MSLSRYAIDTQRERGKVKYTKIQFFLLNVRRPLSLARAELGTLQAEADLVAASLVEIKAGREPPIHATAQTLDDLARTNSHHQIRLLMEIKKSGAYDAAPKPLATPSSTPMSIAHDPPPISQSLVKKPKVLAQRTLAGSFFTRDAEDLSRLVPLPGPKFIDVQ